MSDWTKLFVAATALLAACGGGSGSGGDAHGDDLAATCACEPAQACGVDPCGAIISQLVAK